MQPLASEQHGNAFRLKKINEIQQLLESEREKRRALAKKYQRAINTVTGLSYSLEAVTVGLGAAGISVLATIVATPIAVLMEGVALGTGALSVIGNLVCDKILYNKVKKHNQIMMLAEAKLNTIMDHVSKALKDDYISDEEFTLILSELDKYYQMKDDVKNKSKIDDQTKRSLIQQGKDQAISEFQSMLSPRSNK